MSQIAEANYLHDGSTKTQNLCSLIDSESDTINELHEAGVLLHHLRVNTAKLQDLTHEQHDFDNRNGYLILTHVLTAEEATSLLNDAHDFMKRISKGGNGITRPDASANGGRRPSPIGRVLAKFETAYTSTSDLFEQPIARRGCDIHQYMPCFRTLTYLSYHRPIAKSRGCGTPRITHRVNSLPNSPVSAVPSFHTKSSRRMYQLHQATSRLTFWLSFERAVSQRMTKGDIGLPDLEDLKEPLWAEEGRGDKEVKSGL